MFLDAETLTDPAAAAARFADIALTAIISIFATGGVGGFFVWLFNRRKTNSEVNVNESEIIQNLVNVISGLQKDIESFIEKTRTLRNQVESVEVEKKAADRLIADVKDAEAAKVKALNAAFVAEKEKVGGSVIKMLEIVGRIQSEISGCPNSKELTREGVRLMEMLYYVKTQLLG